MILADLWYILIGCVLFLHLGLAAIDLGVCLISLTADSQRAESMLASIDPVWHTSQTWLVVLGAVLFGAFPDVYATALTSRYGLVMVLLLALGLRGLGLEYRHHAKHPTLWLRMAGWGALAVMVVEGLLIGSLCLAGGESSHGFGLMAVTQPHFFPAILLLVFTGLLMGGAWLSGDPEREQDALSIRSLTVVGIVGIVLMGLFFCFQLIQPVGHDVILPGKTLLVLAVAGLADIAILVASLRSAWKGSPLPWALILVALVVGTGGVLLYSIIDPIELLAVKGDLTFLTIATCIILPPLLAFQIFQYRLERRLMAGTDEEAR